MGDSVRSWHIFNAQDPFRGDRETDAKIGNDRSKELLQWQGNGEDEK